MSSYGELLEAVGKVREEVARIASLFDGMRPEFVRDRLEELGGIGVGRTHEQRLADVEHRVQMRPALDFHDELGALAKRLEALEEKTAELDSWLDENVILSRAPAADPSKGGDVPASIASVMIAGPSRCANCGETLPEQALTPWQIIAPGQVLATPDLWGHWSSKLQEFACEKKTPSPAALPERPKQLGLGWGAWDFANLSEDEAAGRAHQANEEREFALALERRLAEVETERDTYKADADYLTTNRDDLAVRLAEVEKERDGLQIEVAHVRSDRDALAAKLAECDARVTELEEALGAMVWVEIPIPDGYTAIVRCDPKVRETLNTLRLQLSAVKAASETVFGWANRCEMYGPVDRLREAIDALRTAATGEKNMGTAGRTPAVETGTQTAPTGNPVDATTIHVDEPGSVANPSSPHPSTPRPAFALSAEQRIAIDDLIYEVDCYAGGSGAQDDAKRKLHAWIERLVSEEVARAGSGMVTKEAAAMAVEIAMVRQRTATYDGVNVADTPEWFVNFAAGQQAAALRAEGEGENNG